VIENLSLRIEPGEIFGFLGPNGAGKTTTLRIIAGFETLTEGEVLFEGKSILDIPPHKRPVNTVFQKYALFPHMNVYDNIAFGLRMSKKPELEIKDKVIQMLKLVKLEGFGSRHVDSLSGGQQQRVAIARALVNEPKVLLLDEPLGALDLKLRQDMQYELKEMQRNLGITFIFVTHDQEEALTMSDTIVVMNEGLIQQIGSPIEIYNEPTNRFVANFIGESNIIENKDFSLFFLSHIDANKICIRPQDINICEDGRITGEIISSEFKGSSITYHCMVDKVKIKAMEINRGVKNKILPGEKVKLKIDENTIKSLIS